MTKYEIEIFWSELMNSKALFYALFYAFFVRYL